MINLLRHNQTFQRVEDGAIELYKIKFHLRNHSSQIQNWSDDRWKACLAAEKEVRNEDISIALIIWEQFSTSVALQGHSGNNLVDPTLQDNVLIGTGIFPYIYHVGCAFNLHFIINNGLIPGGSRFEQKTNSVLLAC